MGKIYVDSVKYIIKAKLEANGLVEKPDVIGAIFGQTEGLLGTELDLRELQKTGRIGRIEVEVERKNGKTTGEIIVPSGLGIVETSVIAAALETIDRIGPTEARIEVEKIEDVRASKRKYIIDRAKELLRRTVQEELPDSREIIQRVKEELRASEVTEYGPEGLPAGPDIDKSPEIIVVEGRADVVNLLKHGIRNVIALNGNRVPETIKELARRKKIILFVDGDRGGELIIRNVLEQTKVDFIARAPDGKEVEELTQKEILKALRRKLPVSEIRKIRERARDPDVERLEALRGSFEALLLRGDEEVARVPVRELVDVLGEVEADKIIMDGIVTGRIVDAAREAGVKKIVGVKLGPGVEPEGVEVVVVD